MIVLGKMTTFLVLLLLLMFQIFVLNYVQLFDTINVAEILNDLRIFQILFFVLPFSPLLWRKLVPGRGFTG